MMLTDDQVESAIAACDAIIAAMARIERIATQVERDLADWKRELEVISEQRKA